METCRFGVRPCPRGGSDACFEVFDRVTGTAVASGMCRVEAEAEARRRNHDASGSPAPGVRLAPVELAALRTAIDVYLAGASHHSLALVAQAAEALDELRAELAHADRLVAEQQVRIGRLYELFTGRDGGR
jgi:hypothetical protein